LKKKNRLVTPGAVRDATVLEAELDITAPGEGEDSLEVENILLMSPIPGAGISLSE